MAFASRWVAAAPSRVALPFLLACALLAVGGCTDQPEPARVPHSALELCEPSSCAAFDEPTSDVVTSAPCAVSDETEGVSCAMVDGSCEFQSYFCDETELATCGGIAGTACDEGEYCAFDGFACGADDQSGVCRPIPEVCPEIYGPVCGCDRQTYDNACLAAAAGVSVAYHSACGDACGGLGNLPCGAGEYCRFDLEAACGEADQTGTCAPVPEACSLEYAPVCGCDGETYGNECAAAAEGVSVERVGECDAST